MVSFQGWYENFSSNLFVDIEKDSGSIEPNVLEDLVGNTLYIKAGNNMSINEIKIDGNNCNISGNYSGTVSIDVSNCLSLSSTSTPEVLLISDEKVKSKTFFFKDNDINAELNIENTNTFISVWNTSETGVSNSSQIILPLEASGTYDFYVSAPNLIGSPVYVDSFNDNILNFTNPGLNEIVINGTINGWRFNNGGDKDKLYEISQWGSLKLGNNGGYFYGTSNLQITATDILNTSGVTNMENMFRFSSSITSIPNMDLWDVSNVVYMDYMFYEANNFNEYIGSWNTSNVDNMYRTFAETPNFNSNISNWDTSSVTDMELMFDNSYNFNQDLSNWDTNSVIDMSNMFDDAISFNQDISGWNTSNVLDIQEMFLRAEDFNQNLSSWNVDQVTSCNNFDFDANNWTLPKPNFTSC